MTGFHYGAICLMATLLVTSGPTSTASAQDSGAVEQSIGAPLPQGTSPPPLHLSDAQRDQIRWAVGKQDTDVSFQMKETKPAAQFNPAVGAKMPSSVKGSPFLPPLTAQMPELKQYKYVKFKDQVLIVNPMNNKVVDLFPLVH